MNESYCTDPNIATLTKENKWVIRRQICESGYRTEKAGLPTETDEEREKEEF
jgi:hypothetical protein